MHRLQLLFFLAFASTSDDVELATARQQTYCNPLNIDYAYSPIPNFSVMGNHRTTADPVIVLFKGHYFLFSTNQWGYWWSDDLSRWTFVPRKFLKAYHHVYDELCAAAAVAIGDTLLLLGSARTKDFPIWRSTNPTVDDWNEALDSCDVAAWDPDLFLDDDGRLYMYYGSSNDHPIYGQELDRRTLRSIGDRKELLWLHDDIHGWERFGEYGDNTFLRPFIEGAWMTKYRGRYFLQYAAPGTEFSGYADGVYVGEHPFGPFRYQAHNPFSYKLGGFARGAGHGSTFQDTFGNWWHVATIAIGVKNNFERRIGLWPAGFDKDTLLYCNTAYGDYPWYLPGSGKTGSTGWMILNYGKPVTASSTLGGFVPNHAVDENIKTYWSAATGNAGEWFTSDLGAISTVMALQINYADQDAELVGKRQGIFHRYIVSASTDGKSWSVVVDKRRNTQDEPNDYVELQSPVKARFVRIENVHVPTGKFALLGFRVFGKGAGAVPDSVRNLIVLRGDSDRRNAWIKWRQSNDAVGYTIYTGKTPDKLYHNIMVYGANEYFFFGLDRDRPEYFQIEAFNESGIGPRSTVVKAE